jgi:hypothetical protein
MVGLGKSMNVTNGKLLHDPADCPGFARDIDGIEMDYFAVLISVEPPFLRAEMNFIKTRVRGNHHARTRKCENSRCGRNLHGCSRYRRGLVGACNTTQQGLVLFSLSCFDRIN